LDLPQNATLKEEYPTPAAFAEWLFSANPCVDYMRDRQLLNVTLVKVFEMVLLSQSERDAAVHITMPSAMGWSIPSLDSVQGSTNTISRRDSALTRDDFWFTLKEPAEIDVELNAHIFLTAHADMSLQLKEVCATLPFMSEC